MSKQLILTIAVTLPDDPFAAADILRAIAPNWALLKGDLALSKAEHEFRMEEITVRPKVQRRPRKPRLAVAAEVAA